MSKASRLEPLADLADARAAEAARGLAASVRLLEAKRAELAKLESFLEDYRRQAAESRTVPNGASWQNVRAFIARLGEAIAQAERELERLAAGHRAATDRWERSRRQARLLDGLVERCREEEARALDRREQAEQDERASRPPK